MHTDKNINVRARGRPPSELSPQALTLPATSREMRKPLTMTLFPTHHAPHNLTCVGRPSYAACV